MKNATPLDDDGDGFGQRGTGGSGFRHQQRGFANRGPILYAFSRELGTRLNAVRVDEQVRSSIYEQRVKLAGVEVPDSLDTQHREQIKQAITGSYVFGFRLIMIVSAALSLASALCAWGWIGKSRPAKSRQ